MMKKVYNGVDVTALHDAGSILIWCPLVSVCLLLPRGWMVVAMMLTCVCT